MDTKTKTNTKNNNNKKKEHIYVPLKNNVGYVCRKQFANIKKSLPKD